MPNFPDYGTVYHASVTGAVCITSANAQIVGVLFSGTGTGSAQLWAGVTATGTAIAGNIIAYTTVAGATSNQALFVRVPAYCSGGICMNTGPSADPNVTLFWNPV